MGTRTGLTADPRDATGSGWRTGGATTGTPTPGTTGGAGSARAATGGGAAHRRAEPGSRRGHRWSTGSQAREEDPREGEDQDGVHPQQAEELHHLQPEEDRHHEEGVRALHAHRDPGAAAGGQRDGSRVHLRHQEAAAHDHLGNRQCSDPDLPQLPRLSAAPRPVLRPEDVRHGLP